ncbi:MipA/OmpV family protein [Kangiella shandongensis]|uniref:MipA/OmpV family protein n=1 Tax=Kangiella shandongensis TaxID=2763258 RepID=UPI001CC0DB9F|nr:MipA/OmpV family protein [Kangiella shandongensis]
MKFSHLVTAVFILAGSALCSANESVTEQVDCQSCSDNGQWHLGLALGAGLITNPTSIEGDVYFPVVPKISYYSDNFFIDNLTLGYTTFDTADFKLDLTGKLNSDFYYFEGASNTTKAFALFSEVTGIRRTDGLDPLLNFGDYQLRDRKASYLVGPELTWKLNDTVSMKFDARKDVSRIHYGAQATVEFQYINSLQDWYFEQRIGVTWKSKEVNNYYYGISFEETPDELPTGQAMPNIFRENLTYTAKDSFTPYLAFNFNTPVSDDWTFLTSLKVEFLDNTITESPLVDTDYAIFTFIGWGYAF